MSSSQPLAGIRVLSLAEQIPGPLATLLLADLGADVILVERPDGGDPARRFTGLFAALGRNKRSVTIDLKSEGGRARFLALVDTADVVLEGYRPGVMKRLGLDADTLRTRRPELVYLSISSFGQTGPNAHIAGHDLSIMAAAGLVDVPPGGEAGTPLPVLPLADIASGLYAAFGVVTALFGRTRTRRGAEIDVSMFDSLVSWMTLLIVPSALGLPKRPLPPDDPGYGVFATADGRQLTLSIAGEDPMWRALCEMLGLADIAHLRESERIARRAEVQPRVRAAVAARGHDDLCAALGAAKIAFGPVLSAAEVLTSPHAMARRLGVAADGSGAPGPYVRQPLVIDGQVGCVRRPAPKLGEHNAELLGERAS